MGEGRERKTFMTNFVGKRNWRPLISYKGLFKKKVYDDLDHVEKCGFLHGVQHVLNNTFEVFSDIANF